MTSDHSAASGGSAGNASNWERLGRWLLLMGTPTLLGVLFFIHPDGSGGLEGLLPIGDTWLAIHFAMSPLLGLLGVSLYVLLNGYSGRVATTGRVGVAIYMTFYVPFEAIAGITTGLLTHKAQTLPPDQQSGIAAGIDTLVTPSLALGVIGTVGAVIAIVAVGILFRRSGAPLFPVVLLGGVPLATLFHGGTPLDAVGLGLFLVGIAWLELGWRGATEQQSAQTAGETAQ